MKSLLILSLATTPVGLHPTAAQPAAQGGSTALGGSPIAGLCLLSRPAVFARSKVGLAATARLQQLAQQAQSQLEAERAPIEADRKAYVAQQSTLSPADQQTREKALGERLRSLQQKTVLQNREIEATREKALGRVVQLMQPIVATAYREHGCGLLVDRASVLGGNLTNDLTDGVVKALDAQVTTISFDLEKLEAPAIEPAGNP